MQNKNAAIMTLQEGIIVLYDNNQVIIIILNIMIQQNSLIHSYLHILDKHCY